MHRADSLEERPGSPKHITPWQPADLERLLLMSPRVGNLQLQEDGPEIGEQAEPPAKTTQQQQHGVKCLSESKGAWGQLWFHE